MKAAVWLFCLCGVFVFASYMLAVFAPIMYLKLYSGIGFGPFSLSWVVDMARQGLEGATQSYCEEPYILVWNGSFGRLSTLPEGTLLPEIAAYRELVLGNTDYVTDNVMNALAAMSSFNAKLIELCF